MILAIDPGTTQTAYCLMQDKPGELLELFRPLRFDKIPNPDFLHLLDELLLTADEVVCEMMEPRNVPGGFIGAETYQTCYWIGEYRLRVQQLGRPWAEMYRAREKSNLIPSKRNGLPALPEPVPASTDGRIKSALVQRFARHDKRTGKGTAKDPDWFYGFRADIWQAYAIGTTHIDERRRGDADGKGQGQTAGGRTAAGRSRIRPGKA